MKLKNLLLIFFSFLFLSCVTKPAEKTLNKFPHKKSLISNNGSLQLFFPEFSDANGKIIEGDGSVIIFPNKQVMVIDGYFSQASTKYVSYLKSLGITKIDFLVASHFHGDHIQSLPAIIDNFEIVNFYSPGAPTNTWWSNYLLEKIQVKSINHIILKEGDELDIGEIHLKVFSPNLTEEDIYNVYYNPGKTEKLINNTSLVFKITYNKFSIMFTGDVYKNQDRKISKKYGKELKCDLLKLAHHGDFYTANSHTWISKVKPKYGIIIDSQYVTHPWWGYVIRNRYSLHNVTLLYNNKDGYISVISDGNEYTIANHLL